MGDFVNLVNDSGDGFDQQQVEQAIRASLASKWGKGSVPLLLCCVGHRVANSDTWFVLQAQVLHRKR